MNLGLTPEQIAERRNGIGGSDAGKIMSGDWLSLWEIKTGRREEEDLSRVLAVQMGLFTEPLNIFWFERETGHKVFGRGEAYAHPDFGFVRCTLDGLVLIENKPAIVQAKHVSAFAKIEEIEQRYYPQVAHEMLVTGSSLAFLSVFLGTQKWECVEIQRDKDYTTRLLEYEREFWGYVERDEPPPDKDAVAAPAPAVKEYDMKDSNLWAVEAADWLRYREGAKHFDDCAKTIKGLVPPDAARCFGHGIQVKRNKAGALSISEAK